ncbi:MAG: sulfate ABC transporter permease, partial [Bacteroidota bacterium]
IFVVPDPTYNEIRGFYPLSLMNLFDYYEMDKRYAYPLRALNLFEPIYWLALVNGVHFFARKEKSVAWFIVLGSYVLLFFLWLWFYIAVYK